MNQDNLKTNPLVRPSDLKHHAVPFDAIKTEHYLPALEWAIAESKKRVQAIKANSEEPSFSNTIVALETSSEPVDQVSTVFYNLLSAETSDELQALANEFGPKLSSFSSDITLDEELFAKVKSVYDNRAKFELSTEDKQLLQNTFDDFARNGALLPADKKQRLREIDQELSTLSPKFSENVLKATHAFELVIDKEEDLKGLPASAIDAAATAAKEKNYEGRWLFTLDAPSFIPFMKYSENRQAREKIWYAFCSRAFGDQYDNQDVVLKTVRLKHERANLLGAKTHAEFTLQKRMAETPERVHQFIDRLYQVSKPAAERDLAEIQKMADELGGPNPIRPWDFSFYSEKLREKKLKLNEEELRPYFPLEQVINGVFEHATRLYNLDFKSSSEYPTYHKDVKVFEVFDKSSQDFIGLFYTDFFPRPTKKGGAWATVYRDQGLMGQKLMRPHASIVCNFTKPTTDKPSLLTFMEVQTLFHEFGHALHFLLSQVQYRSLSGANVYWDFVELPSQIFENWTLEKEGLALFARHYQTGEVLPDEYIEKIKANNQFLAGYDSLRQVSFALVDMAWHDHQNPAEISDVSEFERQAMEKTSLFGFIPGTNFSCSFSHIFAGGYSAGYYSYKWAEVLDADAFELFKEKGIFNPDVAASFKQNILSRGGTENPMDLYKRFRGREPDPDALLRRSGLL